MKAGADRVAWLRDYYAAMDAQRFDDVAPFLREDIHTVYPTGLEVSGRDKLLHQSAIALGALERIRHDIRNVWVEDDELIFELDVTYWRKDGQVIERCGIGIFVMDGERVAAQRLFVDLNGVWG